MRRARDCTEPVTYEEADRRQEQSRRTRFMRGWDAAIAGTGVNPYQREDYRRNWDTGHRMCLDGKPLPLWYADWLMNRQR
jgi:ribosome modulation factor